MFRKISLGADREIIERKWMESRCGLATASSGPNAHTGKCQASFMYGAKLADPPTISSTRLSRHARRANRFSEGDKINERSPEKPILAAVEYNQGQAQE